ncbi:hypothetical protein WMF31_36105 [Sorangium sp. So ce1036]|uniref:hypothetical protein n=1 Tax=Sorangium sp. So ce1036 TaxID=3133328 RepID=UPI003F0B86A9
MKQGRKKLDHATAVANLAHSDHLDNVTGHAETNSIHRIAVRRLGAHGVRDVGYELCTGRAGLCVCDRAQEQHACHLDVP